MQASIEAMHRERQALLKTGSDKIAWRYIHPNLLAQKQPEAAPRNCQIYNKRIDLLKFGYLCGEILNLGWTSKEIALHAVNAAVRNNTRVISGFDAFGNDIDFG
jgi:hypothetical protein